MDFDFILRQSAVTHTPVLSCGSPYNVHTARFVGSTAVKQSYVVWVGLS
jgi:hypothetical protein